jgi:uncharacterized membrane protein YdjX (TVP38/TMEM64 family)
LIRASGLLALLAIPFTLKSPDFGALTGFVLVTMWLNGPLAPFFPASYEPVLMLYGRLYPPLLVAGLGTAATIYVEYLNYYLYRHLLRSQALDPLRRSRTVNWVAGTFRRSPFLAVWLCSWSPLPYWAVRFLSPFSGYPAGRHLWATLLGRFPRLWFFAALGGWWHIPTRILFAVGAASVAAALVVWALKRRPASTRGAAEERAQPAASATGFD